MQKTLILKTPPADTAALYAQDGRGKDATCFAAYTLPNGFVWLVTEYDPVEHMAFGWACLNDPQNAELGYFSLHELNEQVLWTSIELIDAVGRTVIDNTPTLVKATIFPASQRPTLRDAIARFVPAAAGQLT